MTFQVKNPKKIGHVFLRLFTWNHPWDEPQLLQRPAEQQQPDHQECRAVAGRHLAGVEEKQVVVPQRGEARAGRARAAPTLARGEF